MSDKAVNYTPDMVETMLRVWNETGDLDAVAEALVTEHKQSRTPASVRAKLVREGIYKAPAVKPKATGPVERTKDAILRDLAAVLPFDVAGLKVAQRGTLDELLTWVKSFDKAA